MHKKMGEGELMTILYTVMPRLTCTLRIPLMLLLSLSDMAKSD